MGLFSRCAVSTSPAALRRSFSLSIFFLFSSSWISRMGWRERWPKKMASSSSSSEISWPPPSTMTTPSRLPATTRFTSLWASWLPVGLQTHWPWTLPTRTPAMGPWKGMSEICRAAEAPQMARTSGSFSWSADRTVAMIWTSLKNPLGKRGRRGRSISRAVRISFSLGRPSRLKKPPGIFPAA